MTYAQVIDWLFNQIPNYQKEGNIAYKSGLEKMITFSNALENPHKNFKSIHIAGTNGKGSSAHMLASILQEEGYKVGLFTSPHLKDFTERIRINGIQCEKNFVTDFISKIQHIKTIKDASFFEITTLMAFSYFAEKKVDIAIIETGLGGRLDATNIISPLASVITSIDLDHTELLGNTIEKIAYEKAGIIKLGIPIICGVEKPEAVDIIKEVARKKNATFYHSNSITKTYPLSLQGNYQIQNQKTVLKTIKIIQKLEYPVSEDSITNGLKNVIKNTHLRGRWEIVQQKPTIIYDTAHNTAGIQKVLKQLQTIPEKNLKFVLGFVQGKDIETIISILPKKSYYYFVMLSIQRGISPKEYEKDLQFLHYNICNTAKEGLQLAIKEAKEEDTIVVTGSNFVIADLL